ncbi:uncharacterized protein [Branchiostoma lanceolatum]|uniref:uncharacterized protein n=1 Tax=Branchiostoma lanceolatum TaxID=7740 RepID=UPI0034551FD3
MMELELGGRFNRLFRGPSWSGCKQEDFKNPMKARVNVAGLSNKAINNDIATSDATVTTDLQESALKELKHANPKGRYWIKIDGTDIKPALQQSKKREWNGDVDLKDGQLADLRKDFDLRMEQIDKLDANKDRAILENNLTTLVDTFQNDSNFLHHSLTNAVNLYTKKMKIPTTPQEKLKELNWDVVETSSLLEQSQQFESTYNDMVACLDPSSPNIREVVSKHKSNKAALQAYTSNLFKKKRQPAATHVLVVMLSDEERKTKPYAIPIQFIPYFSLRDQFVRDLTKELKERMAFYGLIAVGTVTDGEFSTLRTRGDTRSLHLWQLIHDARESVAKMSKANLKKMLQIDDDNTCVPDEVRRKMHLLQEEDDLAFEDALHHIRKDLVPDGYTYHTWRLHIPETELDMLRSIIATFRFRAKVAELTHEGVDFTKYLYIPEVDPITNREHHEREDHNHILKRVAKHTRDGGHDDINVRRFEEAMWDKDTGLTHAAVVGDRKQSVADPEKLLSHRVARFFRSKGYEAEAEYVQVIADWHEASDGRGLSQEERKRANLAMRKYILDRWMPWHEDHPDLSKIDINRRVERLCGFSRETIIGITSNIDSQERRRLQNEEIGFHEHPRAGTTDDVECFFSILHHKSRGQLVTLKEFKYYWRKLVKQFCERMDTDRPYYYWSLNERYTEDERPSFDERPEGDDHVPRLHQLHIRSREDSSILAAGRAFLPAKNKLSLRASFHRFDVGLPPVPDQMQAHVRNVLNMNS